MAALHNETASLPMRHYAASRLCGTRAEATSERGMVLSAGCRP